MRRGRYTALLLLLVCMAVSVGEANADGARPSSTEPVTLTIESPDSIVASSGVTVRLTFTATSGLAGISLILTQPWTFVDYQVPSYGSTSGIIELVVTDMPDGQKTLQVSAWDIANRSVSIEYRFIVDTRSPLPPTSMEVPGYVWSSTPVFTWSGARDQDPGSGLEKYIVEIRDTNSMSLSTETIDHGPDPFTYTIPLGVLTGDGGYEIAVKSRDRAGHTSTEATAGFILDTSSPALENPSPTGYIADKRPEIGFRFVDTGSGLETTSVRLGLGYMGTANEITTGFTGNTSGSLDAVISWTPGYDLSDGIYTVAMAAKDRAGHEASANSEFRVDTRPPSRPGAVRGGVWYTSTSRPFLEWGESRDPDAPDGSPGSGLSGYKVEIGEEADKTDDGPWPSRIVSAVVLGETYMPGPLSLEPGVRYVVRVKAIDGVGNESEWMEQVLIYAPHGPERPGKPEPKYPKTTDRTPVWTWTGSRGIAPIDLYHIQIRRTGSTAWDVLDMALDVEDAENPGDQVWETGFGLEDGGYEIRVRAKDAAGMYSPWSETGSVVIDSCLPNTPSIHPVPSRFKGPLGLKWTEIADGDNDVAYDLEWATNMGFHGSYIVTGIERPEYEFNPAGEGKYWFRVRAVSRVNAWENKKSPWSLPVETEYVITGPRAPEIIRLTASPTNQGRQTWTWHPGPNTAGFQVSLNGGEWVYIGYVLVYETEFSTTGTHTIAVRGYDELGNIGKTATAEIETDFTGPGRTHEYDLRLISSPLDRNPTFEWNRIAEPDIDRYELEIRKAGLVMAHAFVPDPGTVIRISHRIQNRLENGVYEARVRGVDLLGNTGEWSPVLVFGYTLLSPSIVNMTPPPGIPYMINDISTLSFDVIGDRAGITVEAYLNHMTMPLGPQYIVRAQAREEYDRYYVIMDESLGIAAGTLTLRIVLVDTLGNRSQEYHYTHNLIPGRTGWGFGRLRPW